MTQVRTTKTELKRQRDMLRRYERYLPTLQLKKQQLQIELRQVEHQLDENLAQQRKLETDLQPWIALFCDEIDLTQWLALRAFSTDVGNVAGVDIPVLREVEFERRPPDLMETPPWVDEALQALEQGLRLKIGRRILEQQRELLAAELRTTSQRVNLFERVKIPECKDAIRTIRIWLGDLQTLDVARGKIAKQKAVEQEHGA